MSDRLPDTSPFVAPPLSGDLRRKRLAGLDKELAGVSPASLLHPIAGKLRVDWRVYFARTGQDTALALEALGMLEQLSAPITASVRPRADDVAAELSQAPERLDKMLTNLISKLVSDIVVLIINNQKYIY